MGFLGASTLPQLVTAALFFPLMFYFLLQVVPKRSRAIELPVLSKDQVDSKGRIKKTKREKKGEDGVVELKKQGFDVDRRQFLKVIGGAGLTLFLFSIFTRRAEAAFFGSVPGPGTVSLKDTSGNQIDPAEKQPTDGYRINQLDDTSDAPNSYYGFVDKDGDWFIMKDDGSGNYRYYKKTPSDDVFSVEWANRTGFTYNYFDAIF